MIEIDWLSGKDPRKMLTWLLRRAEPHESAYRGRMPVATDRKLRLFACGAVRQVWHLLTDERSRRAIEVAERYADGKAVETELHEVHRLAHWASGSHLLGAEMAAAECCGIQHATRIVQYPLMYQPEKQADLLRCVFGNPFRQKTNCKNCRGAGKFTEGRNRPNRGEVIPCPYCVEIWTTWNDRIVHRLAQAIYAERAWDRLPFLADALEEAGCTDQAILDHLRPQTCPECRSKGRRGPMGGMQCLGCYGTGKIGHTGPHCRGCFVIDLLLGKQ